MASSCGAYHEESLRRQRIIDKKRAAKERLKEAEEEQARRLVEKAKQDEQNLIDRQNRKMQELQNHLNDVKGDVTNSQSLHSIKGVPTNIYNQIQRKGKVLRDHNLIIGHPNALWEAR